MTHLILFHPCRFCPYSPLGGTLYKDAECQKGQKLREAGLVGKYTLALAFVQWKPQEVSI